MITEHQGDKEKIVTNGFYSILQIVITTVCYALIYYLIIYYLGKGQLGVWSLISSVTTSMMFLSSGTSGSLLRYVPIYKADRDFNKLNKLLVNGFFFNSLLAIIILAFLFAFSKSLIHFLFSSDRTPAIYVKFIRISALSFSINFIGSTILSTLDGLQLIKRRNVLIIASSLAFCLLSFVLIPSYQLEGLLYAQLIQATTLFITSCFALSNTGFFKKQYLKVETKSLKLFFTYGHTFQYVSILSMVFEPTTKYFLNRYFNINAVGTYDIASRIVNQVRTIIVNAIQVIIPVVAKNQQESKLNLDVMYRNAYRGALLFSAMAFGSALTASFVYVYIFADKTLIDFDLQLLYLTAGFFINTLSIPAYAIMQGLGNLRIILISHLVSTTINFSLFFLLGYFPRPYLVLMPTLIAVILSSVIVLYSFKREFLKNKAQFVKEDFLICLVSFVFPAIILISTMIGINRILLISIGSLHALFLILLIARNNYLRSLINMILKREAFP